VAGRGRAVVTGVGSNTAMGSIRDSMLETDDVSLVYIISLVFPFGEIYPLAFYLAFAGKISFYV